MSKSVPRPTRRFLAISDVAASLSCSPKTVRRMIATGYLTAYRVGPHSIRIDERDVDAFLRRVPSAGGAA